MPRLHSVDDLAAWLDGIVTDINRANETALLLQDVDVDDIDDLAAENQAVAVDLLADVLTWIGEGSPLCPLTRTGVSLRS